MTSSTQTAGGPSEAPDLFPIVERESDVVVHVVGEVDFRTVPGLREALTDALVLASSRTGGRVLLDLSALAWMDSLGLGVLVASFKRARASEVGFALVDPSAKALAILRLARIDQVIPVIDDPFRAA
jgi:anti-anti-sigma factor